MKLIRPRVRATWFVAVPAVGVALGKKLETTPGAKTKKTTNATTMSPSITVPPRSKGMRADAGVPAADISPEPPGAVCLACSPVTGFVLVAELLLDL